MSDFTRIAVKCNACGAHFRAPAAKAGRRGPCPKCGQPLIIPRIENETFDLNDEGLYDVGGHEDAAEPRPDYKHNRLGEIRSADRRRAEQTLKPRLNANSPLSPIQPPTPEEMAARTGAIGGLINATAITAVVTLVFAVVLGLLMIGGGSGVGFLAIFMGAAAGVAMMLATPRRGWLSGAIAAVVVLIGFFGAKLIPAAWESAN
ncbi:MAG: hypothetical protein AAGK78_11395, partial [Planctomycetota bacterium]